MDKPMPLYRASSSNRSSPIAITGPLFSLRFDVESYISAKSELPFPIENVEVLGSDLSMLEEKVKGKGLITRVNSS
ncbi:hypothetical protein LINPERPRIM_LOCUS33417 [Linum perenne]